MSSVFVKMPSISQSRIGDEETAASQGNVPKSSLSIPSNHHDQLHGNVVRNDCAFGTEKSRVSPDSTMIHKRNVELTAAIPRNGDWSRGERSDGKGQ